MGRVRRPGRDHDPPQVRVGIIRKGGEARCVDRVVAHDADDRARDLERLDEVVREAVVVVDDQDHRELPTVAAPAGSAPTGLAATAGVAPAGTALPAESSPAGLGATVTRPTPAASSSARRSAAALCSVSSNSRSGTLRATIPAPAWRCATPPFSTALRMTIAVSRFPS